jgi:hypothetical protein
VRTPAAGRGGSTPPRPPAAKPQQRFVLRPRLPGVSTAAGLPRAAPRPPQPLPAQPRARAHGLLPAPGGGPRAACLTGPGPDSGPEHAMGAGLDEPVIIATVTGQDGEPPVPLLTGGCHRLCKAARPGRAHLPSLMLTATGTPAIRRDAVPAGAAARPNGEPAMITVTI